MHLVSGADWMPGTARAPVRLSHCGDEAESHRMVYKEVLAGSQNHTSNSINQLQPHRIQCASASDTFLEVYVRNTALLECVELMCVIVLLVGCQRASIIVRNGGKPLRVSLRGCGNLLQIYSSSGFWTLPTPASLVLRGQNPLLSDSVA